MWKESIAPLLSQVIREDLFPLYTYGLQGFFPMEKSPSYVGTSSRGKYL